MLSLSRSYHRAPGHTVARSQAQLEASDHHDRHCTTRRLDPEARSGPQEETKRRRQEAGILYASLFNLELKHETPATVTVTVPSSAGLRWHISLRLSPSPSLPPFFGTCKGGGRGSGGFLVSSLSACDGCVAGHERAGCARARGPVGLSSPSPSLTSLREGEQFWHKGEGASSQGEREENREGKGGWGGWRGLVAIFGPRVAVTTFIRPPCL